MEPLAYPTANFTTSWRQAMVVTDSAGPGRMLLSGGTPPQPTPSRMRTSPLFSRPTASRELVGDQLILATGCRRELSRHSSGRRSSPPGTRHTHSSPWYSCPPSKITSPVPAATMLPSGEKAISRKPEKLLKLPERLSSKPTGSVARTPSPNMPSASGLHMCAMSRLPAANQPSRDQAVTSHPSSCMVLPGSLRRLTTVVSCGDGGKIRWEQSGEKDDSHCNCWKLKKPPGRACCRDLQI
mmetsp:Transcript_8368/g.23995  ORF Transcript_8368/g.23995 Transcript_8368/m.23995 type:complete len:240 (+) Transcript_8368:340-1059(+)